MSHFAPVLGAQSPHRYLQIAPSVFELCPEDKNIIGFEKFQ